MADKTTTQNTSLTPPSMANVSFQRVELTDLLPLYKLISDCISGSYAVKKRRELYLPIPNEEGDGNDTAETARYNAYLKRAVFYNVTKRTLSGLVGQIFLRDPAVELPNTMDVLKNDITGGGVTLDQLAFICSRQVIAYGRMGLLVDYPDTDVPATQQQLQKGEIRPSVLWYESEDIINWRTIVVKGKEILSLVVINETIVNADDGFEQKMGSQWRVLSLVNGLYQVDLYERGQEGFSITATYFPKDGKGNRLTEIPFTFIGVLNNDAYPDDPPMYDMAEMNIAHYRNSADYEESSFICGQPTPALTGLTEDWVKNVMKGKISLGARGAILLPQGGDAKLLQATANTLAKEAMDGKERQMVALGAKLVEQKSVQRTLGEAELENTAELSVLGSIAKNVEIAVTFALNWCATFMNAPVDGIKFELNTEFDLTQLDFQERAETIAEWKTGAITTSEMRANLRRGGIATLDDAAFAAARKSDLTAGTMPIVPPPAGGAGPGNPNKTAQPENQVAPTVPAA